MPWRLNYTKTCRPTCPSEVGRAYSLELLGRLIVPISWETPSGSAPSHLLPSSPSAEIKEQSRTPERGEQAAAEHVSPKFENRKQVAAEHVSQEIVTAENGSAFAPPLSEPTVEELTCGEGALVRHALRDVEAEPERHPKRRIVGERNIFSPSMPVALLDAPPTSTVDITDDPMSYEESGGECSEVQEPSESSEAGTRDVASNWACCCPSHGRPTHLRIVRFMRST